MVQMRVISHNTVARGCRSLPVERPRFPL